MVLQLRGRSGEAQSGERLSGRQFPSPRNITLAEVLTVIVRSQQWPLVSPPGPPPYLLVREPDDIVRNLSSDDWFYSSVGAAVTHGLLLFPDEVQIASPSAGSGEYELRFNSRRQSSPDGGFPASDHGLDRLLPKPTTV